SWAEEAAELVRIALAGKTLLEWIVVAASNASPLATALNISAVATTFSLVSAGTGLGWALSLAVGLAIDELLDEPDPDAHGTIVADRAEAKEWESLTFAFGDNDEVTVLSHMGFLSAQNAGGFGVFANRPTVGDWERWRLAHNDNGTVSLRSSNGHYFVAE